MTARRTVLWLQWRGYYVDDVVATPEVVMKNNQAFDMNMAAWMLGITDGMRKHQIRPLAPDCQFKKWQSDKARQEAWLNLCAPFSGCIEPIDEHIAALDLSGHPDPLDIAGQLATELGKKFGRLMYGLGPSKWFARLAAESCRGLQLMSDPAAFLAPLPVQRLIPAEVANRERLEFLGYHTIGEIAALPLQVLQKQFGQAGYTISQASKGLALDEVKAIYPPEMIREPFFFQSPVDDWQVMQIALDQLAVKLFQRLSGQQTGGISLKIEFEEVPALTRERSFKRPVYDLGGLKAALRYLGAVEGEETTGITRLTVELSSLEPLRSQQRNLFVVKERPTAYASVDALCSALGDKAVIKAGAIQLKRRDLVLKEWRNATGWR